MVYVCGNKNRALCEACACVLLELREEREHKRHRRTSEKWKRTPKVQVVATAECRQTSSGLSNFQNRMAVSTSLRYIHRE